MRDQAAAYRNNHNLSLMPFERLKPHLKSEMDWSRPFNADTVQFYGLEAEIANLICTCHVRDWHYIKQPGNDSNAAIRIIVVFWPS